MTATCMSYIYNVTYIIIKSFNFALTSYYVIETQATTQMRATLTLFTKVSNVDQISK